MPNISKEWHERNTGDPIKYDHPVSGWIPAQPIPIRADTSAETLARIEQKLDRLLELLDKDKGLWLAPGQNDIVGRYIKDGE